MSLWVVDIQPAKRLALDGEPIVDVIREAGYEVIETLCGVMHSWRKSGTCSLPSYGAMETPRQYQAAPRPSSLGYRFRNA